MPRTDGVASAAELQRDYENALKRQRELYGPAQSTIDAFEYLVRKNDPAELKEWLDRHPPDEVAWLLGLLEKAE